MFDPNGYAREVLHLGRVIKNITIVKDYQVDYKDKFESQDCAFSRFTVGQVKLHQIDIDVKGIEDNEQNMYRNAYLMKLKGLPINSKPYEDVVEELDIMVP